MKRDGSIWKSGLALGLLLGLLLLTGCQGSGSGTVIDSRSSSEEGSVIGTTEEVCELGAVTVLSLLAPDSVPSLYDLGEGRVLCCWMDFSGYVTTVCVIDVLRDELQEIVELEGYFTLEQVCTDGSALLLSGDGSYYLRLESDFSQTTLTLPCSLGQFSADGGLYYYEQDSLLYVYDLATGESRLWSLPNGLRLCSLGSSHSGMNGIDCDLYVSLYSYRTCRAVIDGETGELLLLREDLTELSLWDGWFYSYDWYWDEETEKEWCVLLFGSCSEEGPLYSQTILESGEVYTELLLIDQSPYLLQTNWVWGEEELLTSETSCVLWRMNEDGSIDCCSLASELLSLPLYSLLYLPEEGLLVVCGYEDGAATLAVLNPEALAFVSCMTAEEVEGERVDSEILASLAAEQEECETPEQLLSVRARADELEQTYGVHILLGEACAAPCSVSGYTVTTTTDAGFADEAAVLEEALDELERVLGLYPTDYFVQLGTDIETDGVYFLLVGSIESDNGVIGFAFTANQREYIAVDVTCSLAATLCHEIWHATESRLSSWGYYFYTYDDWNALNPEGFSYLYSYDLSEADWDLSRYAYFGGWDEICFVDDYSQTYPKEDRARIMEYIMMDDAVAQELLMAPAIRAKLELMCEAIRAGFDTTSWGELWWERYL